MAKHLCSGVQMAKTALATEQHGPTKALVQEIVTVQEARIAAIEDRVSQSE